jgi:hypothetical protein
LKAASQRTFDVTTREVTEPTVATVDLVAVATKPEPEHAPAAEPSSPPPPLLSGADAGGGDGDEAAATVGLGLDVEMADMGSPPNEPPELRIELGEDDDEHGDLGEEIDADE